MKELNYVSLTKDTPNISTGATQIPLGFNGRLSTPTASTKFYP
jgi:hypothetical protein